jgi:hypothetical protein
MARGVTVRLGVEDEAIRSFADRAVAAHLANSRMGSIDAAVDHGHPHAGTATALPCPFWRDLIERRNGFKGLDRGDERLRKCRVEGDHRRSSGPPSATERIRR